VNEHYALDILDPAREEAADAAEYRERRNPGSGETFQVAVNRAIDSVLEMPNSWKAYPDWEREPVVRMRSVGKFGYDIIYFIDKQTVVIVAVAYEGRRPMYWSDRIQEASQ